MGTARQKLNVAFVNGRLLVSAVFGVLTESWIVLFVTLAVLIAGGVYSHEIRADTGRR